MVVTEIIWLILMFFIPGVVSFVIFRHVAGYAINAIYKLIIYSAVFGLIDYTLCELLVGKFIYDFEFGNYLTFWKILSYQYIEIDPSLMLLISVFGFFVGMISGYIVLQLRKIYRPSLHVKLWDHILNSNELKDKEVIITDLKNKVRYEGKIKSFSYFSHYREIVLTNAQRCVVGSKILNKGLSDKKCDFYLHLKENEFDISWKSGK